MCDERAGDFRSAGQHLRCEEHLAAPAIREHPPIDAMRVISWAKKRGVRHFESVGVNTEERMVPQASRSRRFGAGRSPIPRLDYDVVLIVGRRFAGLPAARGSGVDGHTGVHDDVVRALCLRGGGGKLSDRSAADDCNRLAGTSPAETDAVPSDRGRFGEAGVRDVEPGRYLEHLVQLAP